jgi:hypothetical protein
MEHNIENALTYLRTIFGTQNNFRKSEVFYFGRAKEVEDQLRNLFGCESELFPFRFMGISLELCKLKIDEWKVVEDRFEKKLTSWIEKLLCYGDRLILIYSVLTSILMFMLSFFEIPKGTTENWIISITILVAKWW